MPSSLIPQIIFKIMLSAVEYHKTKGLNNNTNKYYKTSILTGIMEFGTPDMFKN